MKWRPLHFLTALCLPLLLTQCGESPSPATPSADAPKSPGSAPAATKGVIGATCMTTNNPFFVTIQDAMKDEAAKHGYTLEYLSADQDPTKQQNQVKDFIVKKVAAIAVNAADSKAIGPVIREANAAGIPVFTFDIKIQDPEAKITCHVGTNNFQGGQLAGEAMADALGEAGGKVVILDLKAAESCQERVRGFKDTVERYNGLHPTGQIQIVAELPGEGNQDRGFKAAEDALQAHPDLRGIFAINDPSGVGAVAALEKAGKLAQVKVVAFDGQLIGKQAIKAGKIYADPIQFPDQIGRKTVQAIVAHFRGDKVEPEELIDSALYTQEDALKDPELAGK